MANLKRHFVVGVPLVRLAAHGRPKKKLWKKQWKNVSKQHAKNTQKKQKMKKEGNGQKNGFQKT